MSDYKQTRNHLTKMRIVLSITLLMTMAGASFANGNDNLTRENTELRQRVEKLEKQVKELTEIIMQRRETPAPSPAEKQPTLVPEPDEKKPQEISPKAKQAETSKQRIPVSSDLDIQLYGYIKADASYDDSRTNPGNYVVWVNSEATNKNDNEFNLTANQTRLGMRINGPDSGRIKTNGLIEMDFYGNYADENKAKIQMRHAYLQINWPDDNFSILAGQTSDVFSPLNPSTLNYTVLWDSGNIGYRRPQIRLTKNVPLDNRTQLKLQGAVARTIGRNSALTGSETGEDAGFPTLQGRAGLTFPSLAGKSTTIGFSGHWGQEQYDVAATGARNIFDSWSVNLDVEQPVNKWMTIKAELFSGENLNTYFGGIGQGLREVKNSSNVVINHANEIASKGGWIAASLGPWDKWKSNIGAGLDDVDSIDVNTGDRILNSCIFGNLIYSVNDNTDIGLELSHWRTEYKGPGDADSLRAQTSLIYKFK